MRAKSRSAAPLIDGATSARATTKAERVDFITEIMQREWLTRHHRRELGETWGLADATIRQYAAEASRRVRISPEVQAQKRIGYIEQQETIARLAVRNGEYRAATAALAEAAKLTGLEHATRVEVTGAGGGPIALAAAAVFGALDAMTPPPTPAEVAHYADVPSVACRVAGCRMPGHRVAVAALGEGEGGEKR